jgi:hypothetical protein
MIPFENRAVLLLASYDFESLQLTLFSLDHTLSAEETVVIVLNGKKTYAADLVERVARGWAAENAYKRHVVRPLGAGEGGYTAITEILNEYKPLKATEFICKIDDDIIPLNKLWVDTLANQFELLSKISPVGFTTGLINNNSWGFNELLDIFNKRNEYEQLMDYPSVAGYTGSRIVEPGKVDDGLYGTLWQYPYLGWWIHELTSCQVQEFVAKTRDLTIKEIPQETYYSIGCVFFKKQLWYDLEPARYKTSFDEMLIHETCREKNLKKYAVLSEPMIHLFYNKQRQSNRELINLIATGLGKYFNDERFNTLKKMNTEDLGLMMAEKVNTLQNEITAIKTDLTLLFNSIEISNNT